MDDNVTQHHLKSSHSLSIVAKYPKLIGLAVLLIGLILFGGWWSTVHASQQGATDSALLADSGGGVTGYVVSGADVAAYACPDVNTDKCPVRLTLRPGTVVQIIDNVIGSNVPGLNDNAWRKIVYKGQTLFVPSRYITVNPPDKGGAPDISLVQTSFEDDSTTAPANATSFTTAPSSVVAGITRCIGVCSCPPGEVVVAFTRIPFSFTCCPQGYTYNPAANPGAACSAPASAVTFYHATDGRVDGNAGDRIAIYCRRTGRIEVWSINDSQGHFLVEFNHAAIDAAAYHNFTVSIGTQGNVTIGGDGHGLYWAAIHGGPFNATGAGDFAKIFHCYVS